jgi:hypothetical protein
MTFLTTVTQVGYFRDAQGLRSKPLPPFQFEYSKIASVQNMVVRQLDAKNLEGAGTNYQFIDLDGEGLPGIFTEQASAWFYKVTQTGLLSASPRHSMPPKLALISTRAFSQPICYMWRCESFAEAPTNSVLPLEEHQCKQLDSKCRWNKSDSSPI